MSQSTNNHPLDRNDPADAPPCPMERLADRFEDCPRPKWLNVSAGRCGNGSVFIDLRGFVDKPDQLDDLINFLARVRG